MRTELSLLKEGKMNFVQFISATDQYWWTVARDQLKRWRVPPCVGEEDVRQELLEGVWQAVCRYRSDGGSRIESYVVRSALRRCRRWLHIQRGAWGHCGKTESRYPVVEGELFHKSVEEFSSPPEQLEAEKILDALRASQSKHDAEVLESMIRSAGDADPVVDKFYGNMCSRLKLRLGSEQKCKEMIRSSLRRTAIAAGGTHGC